MAVRARCTRPSDSQMWGLIGSRDAPAGVGGGEACNAVLYSMVTGSRSHHIGTMQKTHPHAEATYRVIPLGDGSFGVEVKIPETYPTTVSKFATEADAEAWITDHHRRVQSHTQSGRGFTRSRSSHE